MARGPDFVGVGTQRSGTTWWFGALLEHPDIVGPRSGRKELHAFARFCFEPMADGDVRRYRRRFRPAPGQVSGEWTPRYLHDFWVPALLRRAAPDARLLVLLRDPLERLRSGVLHRAALGGAAPGVGRMVIDQADRSRYALQLSRLFETWPQERVLVLQYERCVAAPEAEYRRTLRFLGVRDDDVPADLVRPRGASYAAQRTELAPQLRAGLVAALEPDVARLQTVVPGSIELERWPNFAHLAASA